MQWHVVAQLVEALRYMPEGRGLDSRRCHRHNPSCRTMAQGSTQPLTEMTTRNISWGKGGWCIGLTNLQPSFAYCHAVWKPVRPGALRACPALYRDCFTFCYPLINGLENVGPFFDDKVVTYICRTHSCLH
jgi:hypothetical protein